MKPILIVEIVGREHVVTPDFAGDTITLMVRVPLSRISDVDRNDTLRREVTAALAAALAPPEVP